MPQPPKKRPLTEDNPVENPETARSRRAAGRPQSDGDVVGREALIEAAIALLRTKPHTAIKRYEIAEYARVDPALIRYYFGDMNALFSEVVFRIVSTFSSKMREDVSDLPVDERIRARVTNSVSLFLEFPNLHPLVIDLIFRENNAAMRDRWRETVQISLGNLQNILSDGAASGRFREIDHRMLHLVIVGACSFFAGSNVLLADLFGQDAGVGAKKDEFISVFSELLVNGLNRPQD